MARNDSRPFACSASMILPSSSSVRRAGATGPRSEPIVEIRSGWTSSLRIARDSYHSAAHFANVTAPERRFARCSAERAMGARDRAARGLARIAEDVTVARRKQLRLECPQPAGRLEIELLVPGLHRGERERKREVAGHGGTAEGREHVAAEQRAVARVEEGDVPGGMTGRVDHLETADPIARLEEHVRLRLQLRPGARKLL